MFSGGARRRASVIFSVRSRPHHPMTGFFGMFLTGRAASALRRRDVSSGRSLRRNIAATEEGAFAS